MSTSSSCSDQRRRRRQLHDLQDPENLCSWGSSGIVTIHIATWRDVAPALQEHVQAFNAEGITATKKHSDGEEEEIEYRLALAVFPTLQDLQDEITNDKTGLYDGYVIAPFMVGTLFETQELEAWDESLDIFQELLPFYKNQMVTYDDQLWGLPLLGGSQLLLTYRKDLFQTIGEMEPPSTWEDFTRVSTAIEGAGLMNNATAISGHCLGRQTQLNCNESGDCRSASMSYAGMTLASMTQTQGEAQGWWLETVPQMGDAPAALNPLLENVMERTLQILEEQLYSSASPDVALGEGADWNLEAFEGGFCAMSILANHPPTLLESDTVGFAPLPGSFEVYDWTSRELVECTTSTCPFGQPRSVGNGSGQKLVNQVPFAAADAVMGSLSSRATENVKEILQDFYTQVLKGSFTQNTPFRQQPLTYNQLKSSVETNEEYGLLLDKLTGVDTSFKSATPFRIPDSFTMWNDLDREAYNYLKGTSRSDNIRTAVRQSIEKQWRRTIDNHNEQFNAVPLSIFYEKSLGTFSPTSGTDIYIGDLSRYIGWGFGFVGVLLSVFFAALVLIKKHDKVIRSSQPTFLMMICAGSFFMSLSIFPFGIEDDIASQAGSDAACMSGIWMYSLGFVMTMSALSAKTWKLASVRFCNHTYSLLLFKYPGRCIV